MESIFENIDFLVCLSAETTHDSSKFKTNYRCIYKDSYFQKQLEEAKIPIGSSESPKQTFDEAEEIRVEDQVTNCDFPNIIELDW